ncbi:MAG: hypothetical protein WCO78_04975 [Candidatus Roizmanbacteria bacterium]
MPENKAKVQLTVESVKDDLEATIKLELIIEDGSPLQLEIDENGNIYSDIHTAEKVILIINNLFDVSGKEAKLNTSVFGSGTASLKWLRSLEKKKLVANKPIEPEGNELHDYESTQSKKTAIEALRDDVHTLYNEAPEIEGIDRNKLIANALSAVKEHTRGKIDPEQQKLLDSLLSSHHILFLAKKDYDALLQDWTGEETNRSTAAMTYLEGVISINQDEIVELARKNFRRYNLVRTQENLPKKITSTTEALGLFADYVGYRYGTEVEPIELPEPVIDDKQSVKELTENLIWSFAFHEGLHVASGNTSFLDGLSEAATHYYTAVTTLQERGINALGAYLTFSDLSSALNWIFLMKDLPITEDIAEQMYYNKSREWTMEKMFGYVGKENQTKFYDILTKGRVSVTRN